MPNWRQQAVKGIKVGDTFSDSVTLTMEQSLAFGRLTGDFNPVHYDPEFCKAKGFDGLILHGLLVVSIISRLGGQVAWLLAGMNFKLTKPVYPGDTITSTITITEIDARMRAKAVCEMRNQHGFKVLDASFSGVLPNEEERGIMARMLAQGDPTNGINS
jgi:3-hydroxybutyryl-CoA dehydratase